MVGRSPCPGFVLKALRVSGTFLRNSPRRGPWQTGAVTNDEDDEYRDRRVQPALDSNLTDAQIAADGRACIHRGREQQPPATRTKPLAGSGFNGSSTACTGQSSILSST